MKKRDRISLNDPLLVSELKQAFPAKDLDRALRALQVYLQGGQEAFPGFEVKSQQYVNDTKFLKLIIKAFPEPIRLSLLQDAYALRPQWDFLIERLMEGGEMALRDIVPTPMVAVRPALAKRFNGPEEALAQAGTGVWLLEPKLDGWECQIHVQGSTVRLFSRTHDNLSSVAPEVTQATLSIVTTQAAILEAELLAVDPITGYDLPHTKMKSSEVAHRAVVFDVILLGEDKTRLSCRTRFNFLKTLLAEPLGNIVTLTEQVEVDNDANFKQAFANWKNSGREGMIGKRPDAPYEAGKRTSNRIKIKPLDTVDAILLGYSSATGAYLVAVANELTWDFVPFAWVVGGLKADQHSSFEMACQQARVPNAKPIPVAGKVADVVFQPSIIVEIGGDHIHPSQKYPCGRDLTGQGWTLYGAKFLGIRDDKGLNDVTTESEFLSLPVMSGHERPIIQSG